MKHAFLYIFICFSIIIQGQNLVPNHSFEEYYTCPGSVGGLGVQGGDPWIINWYSMQWTPDYFHYCVGEPGPASNYPTDNAWGYQEPYDGDGYVGFGTKSVFNDVREYIAVELQNPLEVGEVYNVSFFVSDADGGEAEYIDCVTNNIGLRFLINPTYYWNTEFDNFPLLPENFADINFSELMVDSVGWTGVTDQFVADEAYTHIAFGNHFDDANTLIVESGEEEGCWAFYYLDNVCVVKQGDECEIPMAISEFEIRELHFQNIVQNELDLSNVDQYVIDEMAIFDVSGELVLINKANSKKINTSTLSKGLYILRVKFYNGLINNYKFIKQ